MGVSETPDLAFVGANIKRIRQSRQLTLEDVAARCDPKLDTGSLSRIERGGQNMTTITLSGIARALGVPLAAFFSSLGGELQPATETASTVPLVNLEDLDDVSKAKKKAQERVFGFGVGKSGFAFRVKSDEFLPEFRRGDIVIIDPERKPKSGRWVLVYLGGNGVVLRLMQEVDGRQYLVSPNRSTPLIPVKKGVKILGVLRQSIRDW